MAKASSDAKKASGGGWAAFVGALLGSGVLAALVALIPQYFPASPRFEWVKAGLPASDCTATDTAATYSSAKPQPENCASADEDYYRGMLGWERLQKRGKSDPQSLLSMVHLQVCKTRPLQRWGKSWRYLDMPRGSKAVIMGCVLPCTSTYDVS